jgi:hypothetical protein
MYDKDLVSISIRPAGDGFHFVTADYGDVRLWTSESTFFSWDAGPFVSELRKTISELPCRNCGIRADWITDFGDLHRDISDIGGFCSASCYELAMEELDALR